MCGIVEHDPRVWRQPETTHYSLYIGHGHCCCIKKTGLIKGYSKQTPGNLLKLGSLLRELYSGQIRVGACVKREIT